MKTLSYNLLLALLSISFNVAAAPVTVSATADTTITRSVDIPSPAGASTVLYSINFGGFESYPLIKFDLSSFASSVVQGNGVLSLTYLGFLGTPSQDINVSTVKNSWNEATSTYSNFNPISNTDVLQSTLSVNVSGLTQGIDKINFMIPNATLQDWISNPATNNGLLLDPTSGRDIYFYSKESAFAPTLTFDVAPVPEPETYAMMLLGLGLIGLTARRKQV